MLMAPTQVDPPTPIELVPISPPEFFAMFPSQINCACGKAYWPNQVWAHRGCVVNASVVNDFVVNDEQDFVVNKDRHRKTPERAAYMREYMRKYRQQEKS